VAEQTVTTTPAGRHARFRAALPLLILLACATTYAVVTWYVALLRFESFNSSVDDLGFFNQLMWITLHGGPSAWATYAQANFYAYYPWQTSTFLLLVPVYAAFPSPVTLLVVQSVAISFATVPIYLLARKYGLSAWAGLALGAGFLLDFQIQSVTLFDFHLQTLYPLTFFSMVLFYEYGWKKLFLVAGAISLITNPLTLAITVFFVAAMFLRDSTTGWAISKLPRRILGWLTQRPFVSLLLILGVALAAVELWAGLVGGYHLGQSVAQGGPRAYFPTVPTRLLYLAVTFLPLLAAAFLVRETQVLLIPLIAWLALADFTFIVPYIGRPDVIEFVVVGFWGLILFASRHPGRRVVARLQRAAPKRWPRRWGLPSASGPNYTVAGGVAVVAVVCIAMSPLSPWNVIPQTVADINETIPNITTITPADHFLSSVLSLIPANASLLTQNNIPQLTGRYSFQWPMPPKPAPNITQANYILTDQSASSFSQIWYSFLRPYVMTALETRDFGILAMGYGILLLERGYHGPPEVVGPLPYGASEMSLRTGYRSGSIAVHPPGVASTFWYGPYVDLPAGNYTATFRLMIGPGAPPNTQVVILSVTNESADGQLVYSAFPVHAVDFSTPDVWTNFTIGFTLTQFVVNAEFPGLWTTNAATIYFGGVTVNIAPGFAT